MEKALLICWLVLHPHSYLQVDTDTMEMLRAMNMGNLPGLQLAQVRESGKGNCLNTP